MDYNKIISEANYIAIEEVSQFIFEEGIQKDDLIVLAFPEEMSIELRSLYHYLKQDGYSVKLADRKRYCVNEKLAMVIFEDIDFIGDKVVTRLCEMLVDPKIIVID